VIGEDAPPAVVASRAAPPSIPRDLRLWVRHSNLLRSAQGIAQETGLVAVKPTFSPAARRFQHPWRMLTLLTFSAAVGVSSDRAASSLAAIDPELRELCRGDAPSPSALRGFRNWNRDVLIGCLGQLLRHAWCHRHRQEKGALTSLLLVEMLCEARARVHRWRGNEEEWPAG
jgi:hypothetical protein